MEQSAEARSLKSKVVLVIPAYRPGAILEEVVQGIQGSAESSSIGMIVIVDDGSGPEFNPIFERVQSNPLVRVVRHIVNLGKGAALKTGFNYALVHSPDAVGVVTADADGQHAPADILRVAARLSTAPDRLVLGVRQFKGDHPMRSRFGNSVTRTVFRFFTGQSVADTQTGLRGWPRRYCEECMRITINGYDFELQCLMNLGTNRAKALTVEQLPIETIYLDDNRSSHFNPVRDSMRIYFVFLRYCGSSTAAAIVDSLTFYLVFRSTQNMIASQIAGRALAVCVAFVLARTVVFRSKTGINISLAKYLALVAVMGFVSFNLIRGLNGYFGLNVMVSKLMAEGMLFLGNFAIQRDFVFARPNRES